MSNYGDSKNGKGYYGGGSTTFIDSSKFILIEIYDSLGAYKGAYKSGSCDLINLSFSHNESGCRDFSFSFASIKDIDKDDKIKIKIFNSDDYFFTGIIRTIPISGDTKKDYKYSGFGYTDYFERLNTGSSLTFTNKSVNYIVNYLLDNIICPNSLITKNLFKIDSLTTIISSAKFHYIQISEALDQLKSIANSDGNDYLIGVDQVGDFFFRARSTDVKTTLSVGTRGDNSIEGYEPEDEYEAVTKYHVLKKDGTYYKTITSSENNPVNVQKLTAPDIADADIDLWAAGILKEMEINKRSASIKWKIKNNYPLLLTADGKLRVISAIPPKKQIVVIPRAWGRGYWGRGTWGGTPTTWKIIDDTLNIVEVNYTISDKEAMRSITLGTILPRLENEVIKIRKRLINLEISLGV